MTDPKADIARTSDLLAPPRAKLRLGSPRRYDTLTNVVVAAFVIAALSVGRQIFVPIAIAVLLSFVMAPPVLWLRAWGVPRMVSVLLVVAVAFGILIGLAVVLTRQISDLANDIPRYQTTIAMKVDTLRQAASASTLFERASEALRGFDNPLARRKAEPSTPKAAESTAPAPEPVPVEVHQPAPGPMEMLRTIAATVLEPLATTGIVAIFIIFILMQREDLRDRLIRLLGGGDLHRTTVALDDAASRLSRFFLVQFALNASFGVVIGIGLSLIGVPSPVLWGLLAAIMRFVPYIGAFVAGLGPVALAAAVDPGWSMVVLTIALFIILEPLVGQVVEPLLYGHSTGLSPIAVVVAATFWTWLWGPVGLLLSTPLTVCLVVIGRHAERLSFLDIVLSDAPALTPPESFYQRILAGDPSEAAEQADDYLRTHRLVSFYEDIAMQGLAMAQADLRRGLIDLPQQAEIRDTIVAVVQDLDEAPLEPTKPNGDAKLDDAQHPFAALPVLTPADLATGYSNSEAPILCIGARSALDEAAASMLAQLLQKHGIGAKVAEAQVMTPGRIGRLPTEGVELVCLSAFDADLSAAHVRYAVRRIRRRLPNATLVACFWMPDEAQERADGPCKSAGVDVCAPRLTKALNACIEAAQRKPEAEQAAAQGAVA